MSTPDIASVMQQAMDAEDRRRELAGQSPGLGALVNLPQPPSGPGVGLSDVSLPVVGEGYDQTADISAAVQKAYGEARPTYADGLVGGTGFQAGRSEPAIRHVQDLGADGLLIDPGPDGRQRGGQTVTVSPDIAPRRTLLQRLLRRR